MDARRARETRISGAIVSSFAEGSCERARVDFNAASTLVPPRPSRAGFSPPVRATRGRHGSDVISVVRLEGGLKPALLQRE